MAGISLADRAAVGWLSLGRLHLFIAFEQRCQVGSGTAADLFRRHCGAIARRVAAPGAMAVWPWRGGTHCGLAPHEHATMDVFHEAGLEGFELCTHQRAPVRPYTILRDPVDKFLSGIYFWKRCGGLVLKSRR